MQASTKERTATKPAAATAKQMSAARRFWRNPAIIPTAIFALAFFLRFLYNAVFMDHRIAHFGDAYNFMRTGSALLEAATSSPGISEFLSKIYHPVQAQAQLLQSMTSMNLTDRLMIDGPVFPAYLAVVEWITGVQASKPIFDGHSVQICLCNSFIDSLSCLFVYFAARLAFNRKTAVLAGLLLALYPPAIINTQHCYSEPFSYFLLSGWAFLVLSVLLRHQKKPALQALAWLGIGALSGLMMLSKPAFILIPPMVAAAVLPVCFAKEILLATVGATPCVAQFDIQNRIAAFLGRSLKKSGLALLGALIVLSPWVIFNKAATGQYSVFVNRVPSFNIFHGNQIGTDAWRCYPFYGTFPGENKQVITSLLADAKEEPILFIGLQFKKMARLWSGVWNEYHYSLFGIPIEVQSLLHQLLLLGGALGLSYFLFKSRHKTLSREFKAGCVLGTIVLFHFAYIPFEAISRYAITAMPALIILFAALVNKAFLERPTRTQLLFTALISTLGFGIISQSGQIAAWFASVLPASALTLAPVFAVFIDYVCFLLSFAMSAKLLSILIENKNAMRWSLTVPAVFTVLAMLVAAVYTIQSHDWKEWQCSLGPQQSVSQTIYLPEKIGSISQHAFVLIDLNSDTLAAPVEVRLNGETLKEPLVPLAQLQPNNNDILQCLAIQAEGMSRDVRGFRNWWVVPCLSKQLHPGNNRIEIASPDGKAGATVYGDYILDNGVNFLPSLRSFSYTKGFTTFDHRDPRVFEKLEILGETVESKSLSQSTSSTYDLSEAFGTQTGRYRMRLLIPQQGMEPERTDSAALARLAALSPVQLVGSDAAQRVSGKNPLTFVPPVSTIKLPEGLPSGSRFTFSCQTRSLSGSRPCFVSLSFSGQDHTGNLQSWTSKWQPIGIASSKSFRRTSFTDTIPDEILSLKNLEIHPMFSPFQPDFLFLKKKEALKNEIEVRDASLHFLSPLDLCKVESRTFQVY